MRDESGEERHGFQERRPRPLRDQHQGSAAREEVLRQRIRLEVQGLGDPGGGVLPDRRCDPGGAINPQTDGSATKAPTIYFGTDNIDATLKKIKDAGGKADEKAPIPGQGWFAACVDLDGNAFSVYQNDASVTMEQMAEYQATHA